jgi:hypothetical protein
MSEAAKSRNTTPLPDLFTFMKSHGRLPRLGDTLAPWQYHGWLLPYVILLHTTRAAVANRWGYYLRTLEAGKLLDEPIPQVVFGPPDDRRDILGFSASQATPFQWQWLDAFPGLPPEFSGLRTYRKRPACRRVPLIPEPCASPPPRIGSSGALAASANQNNDPVFFENFE